MVNEKMRETKTDIAMKTSHHFKIKKNILQK